MKNPKEILNEKAFDIVITVLSIIQGLAFSYLAEMIPDIYSYTIKTFDFSLIIHFLICLAILIRVFQTYVTAIIDYKDKNLSLNLFDLFTIFLIGILEYLLFSSLDTPKSINQFFQIKDFHIRLSYLTGLSLIGYVFAFFRLREEDFGEYLNFKREKRLQRANISGTLAVLSISIYIIASDKHSNEISTILGTIILLLIAFNIFYSITTTFNRNEIESITTNKNVNPPNHHKTNSKPQMKILINRAKREDVIPLVNLILENFSYVYINLFETSLNLTRRIIRKALLIRQGNYSIGYQSFYVAKDSETNLIVGMFLLAGSNQISFFVILRFSLILLQQIGMVGLVRTIRNFTKIKTAIPQNDNESLTIAYIAVKKKYQQMSVGKQMIDYIKKFLIQNSKKNISLEVRESNTSAITFFEKQGFLKHSRIVSDSDTIFEKGARVKMTYSIKS